MLQEWQWDCRTPLNSVQPPPLLFLDQRIGQSGLVHCTSVAVKRASSVTRSNDPDALQRRISSPSMVLTLITPASSVRQELHDFAWLVDRSPEMGSQLP